MTKSKEESIKAENKKKGRKERKTSQPSFFLLNLIKERRRKPPKFHTINKLFFLNKMQQQRRIRVEQDSITGFL